MPEPTPIAPQSPAHISRRSNVRPAAKLHSWRNQLPAFLNAAHCERRRQRFIFWNLGAADAVRNGPSREFAKATLNPTSEDPVSRGYGELQRQLLTILTEHGDTADRWRGLDTVALARAAHGREPTRGEVVPVRRAQAGLMRNGEMRIYYELRASALLGQGAGSARTSGLTCSRAA